MSCYAWHLLNSSKVFNRPRGEMVAATGGPKQAHGRLSVINPPLTKSPFWALRQKLAYQSGMKVEVIPAGSV